MTAILGISAYYHDSAAALLIDGRVVSAAQEERFSRRKHDPSFPSHAIRSCLDQAGLNISDLDSPDYEKPLLTFERLLETYIGASPRGGRSFVAAMQTWLKEKLFLKRTIQKNLQTIAGAGSTIPPLLFSEHHLSHAAAAFLPSPFESAAVLCMDGVGEWATTSAWIGTGNEVVVGLSAPLGTHAFPHSLTSVFSFHLLLRIQGEFRGIQINGTRSLWRA